MKNDGGFCLPVRSIFTALILLLMGGNLSAQAQSLQCVTFAREHSSISLRGDAWTWWSGAAGQYERGQTPRRGAVVVFKKHGSMQHGHVAVVASVINSRKVLVDHANWAPHRGHGRGQIAKMVVVSDVSPRNDWSEVRVWNEASGELGQRIYPTFGFIYPRAGHLAASIKAGEGLADSVPSLAAGGNALMGDEATYRLDNGAQAAAVASLTDLLTPSMQSSSLAMGSNISQ
jgi:surface antigen